MTNFLINVIFISELNSVDKKMNNHRHLLALPCTAPTPHYVIIDPIDILCVFCEENCLEIYYRRNQKFCTVSIQGSLAKFLTHLLPIHQYAHRNYVVNVLCIREIIAWRVLVLDDPQKTCIPIRKKRKHAFKRLFKTHFTIIS